MKYFLAIDKGNYYSNVNRFTFLDLASINKLLGDNNNLRFLAEFTCTFDNIHDLKYFLNQKNILSKELMKYNLVICYKYGNIRYMDVAYKCDAEYVGICHEILNDNNQKSSINLSQLYMTLKLMLKKREFLDQLLKKYIEYKSVRKEVCLMKAYADSWSPSANQKLYDEFEIFFTKLCKQNSKYLYKNIYDLGLFVSKVTNRGRNSVINTNFRGYLNAEDYIDLDDPVIAFEIEQNADRMNDDGQLSLFRM